MQLEKLSKVDLRWRIFTVCPQVGINLHPQANLALHSLKCHSFTENTLWFHHSQHELNTKRHNFYYFSEHFCFLLLSRQDVPQSPQCLSQDVSSKEVKKKMVISEGRTSFFANLHDISAIRAWGARFRE